MSQSFDEKLSYFERYGEHWRYVYELEKEARMRSLRRSAIGWVVAAAFATGMVIGGLFI